MKYIRCTLCDQFKALKPGKRAGKYCSRRCRNRAYYIRTKYSTSPKQPH